MRERERERDRGEKEREREQTERLRDAETEIYGDYYRETCAAEQRQTDRDNDTTRQRHTGAPRQIATDTEAQQHMSTKNTTCRPLVLASC